MLDDPWMVARCFGGQKRDCDWTAPCRVVGSLGWPHATYYDSGQLRLRLEWRLTDHFMVDNLKGDNNRRILKV